MCVKTETKSSRAVKKTPPCIFHSPLTTFLSVVSLISLSICSICLFAPLGEDQVPSVWSCEPSCGTPRTWLRSTTQSSSDPALRLRNVTGKLTRNLLNGRRSLRESSWPTAVSTWPCSCVMHMFDEAFPSLNPSIIHNCRFTLQLSCNLLF